MYKKLDDNSQTKSDRKDSKTIALLLKDGRYRDVYIPADLYQELREAVSEQERLQEQLMESAMVTAAVIISEIGNIGRFEAPRQILKMAGLSLKENSSGKHKGKTTISKRGRRRLRKGLFRVMIPILATNEEFKAMHRRNLTREKNPLSKMQPLSRFVVNWCACSTRY